MSGGDDLDENSEGDLPVEKTDSAGMPVEKTDAALTPVGKTHSAAKEDVPHGLVENASQTCQGRAKLQTANFISHCDRQKSQNAR